MHFYNRTCYFSRLRGLCVPRGVTALFAILIASPAFAQEASAPQTTAATSTAASGEKNANLVAQPYTNAYSKIALDGFQQAEAAYKNEDWINARQLFTYVRNRYPYSQFAALSELRIGDVYFQQEQYASAVQQYRGFIRLYPDNPNVPYAAFKTAMAFYKGMPEESLFILPPAYEIDRDKAVTAERELQYFLRRHPDTPYTKEAKSTLRHVQRRLADHELYTAKFYMERDNFRAGASRLKYLLSNYSGVGLDDQALILLAHCDIELKDMNAAFAALSDLVEFHKNSPYYQEAKDYLEKWRPSTR